MVTEAERGGQTREPGEVTAFFRVHRMQWFGVLALHMRTLTPTTTRGLNVIRENKDSAQRLVQMFVLNRSQFSCGSDRARPTAEPSATLSGFQCQ